MAQLEELEEMGSHDHDISASGRSPTKELDAYTFIYVLLLDVHWRIRPLRPKDFLYVQVAAPLSVVGPAPFEWCVPCR